MKQKKLKNIFPVILLLLTCTMFSSCGKRKNEVLAEKPNVIIILADDMGYADVGFNGCKDIPTPNIDRLAGNGAQCTNGYVTFSVCGPSRAGLMTGRHQDRFGFSRNPLLAPNDIEQGLPLTEETMASALKRADYATMALGKWHLGAHPAQWPLSRGFDEFYGFLSGGHMYFPKDLTVADITEIKSQMDGYRTKMMKNCGRVEETEYVTDALTREAVSFIERKKDEPFFIYLAYNAPHTPMQATEKYLSRFEHIKDKRRKTYAAMVSSLDDGVGRVLDKLEELGIDDNTIVFFLSDNGGPEKHNGSDNGPLREGKGSFYEGGIHVPFAVQWTSHIPAGTVYENPVWSLDMFATALAYAGIEPQNELDGVNIVPYLSGDKKGSPHKNIFLPHLDYNGYALRSGDYKVINFRTDTDEMYNLKEDIGEQSPLQIDKESEYKRIKNDYAAWVADMKEPVFLGLADGAEYNKLHPDRFVMQSPYKESDEEPKVPELPRVSEDYKMVWTGEFDENGNIDNRIDINTDIVEIRARIDSAATQSSDVVNEWALGDWLRLGGSQPQVSKEDSERILARLNHLHPDWNRRFHTWWFAKGGNTEDTQNVVRLYVDGYPLGSVNIASDSDKYKNLSLSLTKKAEENKIEVDYVRVWQKGE
ncbi:MAG: sulfatase-like hydrolase/transferase [Bacteroidales bacterium]